AGGEPGAAIGRALAARDPGGDHRLAGGARDAARGAGSAVGVVVEGIDAHVVAVERSRRTGRGAAARAVADESGCAGSAAGAAVVRVLRDVHALAAAGDLAGGAGDLAHAAVVRPVGVAGEARGAGEALRGGGAAAAVVGVGLRVHAGRAADGQARRAGERAL